MGIWKVLSEILGGPEGWRGLFVGYSATLLRDIPYTVLELGLYENIKAVMLRFHSQRLQQQSKIKNENANTVCFAAHPSIPQNMELLAAALTGAIASIITTPLDLVKTKLMTQVSCSVNIYFPVDW